MNRILLDTSAYIHLLRGSPEILTEVRMADEVFLNAVILGELQANFLRGKQTAHHQRKLVDFLESARTAVLPVDSRTADHYARILAVLWKAGTPIPSNDVWISASAMQHGLRVLTFDSHFKQIPQLLVTHLEP